MEIVGETTAGKLSRNSSVSNFASSSSSFVDSDRLKLTAAAAIDAAASTLNDISQEIWKNPELHFREYKAHALLSEFFETSGFSVERSYKLETAFRATFRADGVKCLDGVASPNDVASPNIAILCEYDALPDLGHACGHNLIAEVGVGAALGVKAAMESSGIDIGQVIIINYTPF